MPKRLEVDPVELHMASAHLTTAAEEHVTDAARHMGDLTDAVSRWSGGASLAALKEVAEHWETQHTQRQARVHTIGQHVTHCANAYIAADSGGSAAINSTPVIGSDPGSSPDVSLRM